MQPPIFDGCEKSRLALAGLLFMATPILFAGTFGASKVHWDLILAEKKEAVLRRGVIVDATVVYWETTWSRYNSTTNQTETYYNDEFEFHFAPNGAAQVVKKVSVPEGGWSDHDRFFDIDNLLRAIKKRGQVLGNTSLFRSADYIGRQLQHVKLLYDPDELINPEAMRILLPEYPPQRWLRVHSVIDWIFRTLLALVGGLVGGLPILLGGYFCFVYFLGPPTAKDGSEEEIAVYDDLIDRYSAATELPLCELVREAESEKNVLHKSSFGGQKPGEPAKS